MERAVWQAAKFAQWYVTKVFLPQKRMRWCGPSLRTSVWRRPDPVSALELFDNSSFQFTGLSIYSLLLFLADELCLCLIQCSFK